MRDLLQNNLVGGEMNWVGREMKEAGLELMVDEAGWWLWFLKSFSLLLYVFENNIKLKTKRNIVSMPFLFQRNPLSGEISNNLVTGECLGA